MRVLFILLFIFIQFGLVAQIDGTTGIITSTTKARLDAVSASAAETAQFGYVTETRTLYKWNGTSWVKEDNLGVSNIVSVVRSGNDLVINYELEGVATQQTLINAFVGDNLGNHTATQNIQLNNKYLSGDGGNEGIFVSSTGNVGVGTNSPIFGKFETLSVNTTLPNLYNRKIWTDILPAHPNGSNLMTYNLLEIRGEQKNFNYQTSLGNFLTLNPLIGDTLRVFNGRATFNQVNVTGGGMVELAGGNFSIAGLGNSLFIGPNTTLQRYRGEIIEVQGSTNSSIEDFIGISIPAPLTVVTNFPNPYGISVHSTYLNRFGGSTIFGSNTVLPSANLHIVGTMIHASTEQNGYPRVRVENTDGNIGYVLKSSLNTDNQTLSRARTGTVETLSISGGNSIAVNVADNDNSITNEIQSLSITSNQLTISGSNTITLPTTLPITINQSAHDFTQIGQPIFAKNGIWDKSTTANHEFLPTAYVEKIIDANNFTVAQADVLNKPSHGLTIGAKYFLKEDGTWTTTRGQSIVCEIFTPIDANHIQLNRTKPYSRFGLVNNLAARSNIALPVYQAGTISIKVKTFNSSGYNIFWGDGTSTSGVNNSVHSHTYSSTFTGEVELKALDGIQVEEIVITGAWNFSTEQIFNFAPRLELFDSNTSGKCYGNLSFLPNSVTSFNSDVGYFYGDITEELSENLTYFRCVTGCKVAANWNELGDDIQYIGVTGGVNGANFYGDISSVQFTNPTHFDVQGKSTLKGDIGLLGNFPVILNLNGKCNINKYTAKANGGTMNFINPNGQTFIIAGLSSLTSTEVDNILIDLNSETTSWSNSGNIIINAGSNRTTASNTAVTALKGKGASITVNGVAQ